jgi:hypothetical protein
MAQPYMPDPYAEPEPKKSNTGLIIAIVVVVLLLCCCCVTVAGVLGYLYRDQLGLAQALPLLLAV